MNRILILRNMWRSKQWANKLWFDPNESKIKIKEWVQNLKKKIDDNNPMNNPDSNLQNYLKFLSLLLLTPILLYHLKKEKATKITVQQLIEMIKKSQINAIYIIKESQETIKKNSENSDQPEKTKLTQSNSRNIYLYVEGHECYTYVPQIDFFYDRIKQIESHNKSIRVKFIERQEKAFDYQFRRFFTSLNKLVLPLLFPLLLFNSSIGKIFKSNFLKQNDAFRPKVKFKDIAGLGNAKIQISQLVDFLKNPQKYKRMGARVPRGALLSGPPGTGKTMLAKACAGEADVPFFSVSGSQFVQLYAGMGATRVRALFINAKKKTPSIIFIDQIDAIGRKRDDKFGGAHDQRANTLNQLLVQMDGFGTANDIIVLAATNRKQMLDNALTRPGRFDRIVEIQLPDIRGRQEILQIYLNKIKLSPIQTLVNYAKRLATLTYGFSGADLANLCNEAAILAVRKNKEYVEPEDFEQASDRVLAGLEQTLNLDEKEKKKIAYHQAGHAVIAWFSQGASPLLKITIVPRSKGSLGFAQYLPSESSLMNKKQLIDQMCVILGGRMSEEYFFKQVTNGAADDLKKVRHLAHAIIVNYGMSDLFPNYAPIETEGHNVFSQETSAKIDKQIIKLITQCTKETRKTVKLYQDEIKNLAEAVLKKQTLNHNQIQQILGKRPFQVKQNYKQFLQNMSVTTKFDLLK